MNLQHFCVLTFWRLFAVQEELPTRECLVWQEREEVHCLEPACTSPTRIKVNYCVKRGLQLVTEEDSNVDEEE